MSRKRNSYSLFTRQVIEIVRSIPPGTVASYGQVARAAGNPKGARQTARILHSLADTFEMPWHRVVSLDGCIRTPGYGNDLQKSLLAQEGVEFDDAGDVSRIDMDRFRWQMDKFGQ